jgi:hypothetical protein
MTISLGKLLAPIFGLASAVAGASGVVLLAMWVLDAGSDLPELIGGICGLAAAALMMVARRFLQITGSTRATPTERAR